MVGDWQLWVNTPKMASGHVKAKAGVRSPIRVFSAAKGGQRCAK